MDVSDLRVFEAVARLGGMNRAAAELNTVQSNVTTRIRLLEEELGAPLFRRHNRGTNLTEAGGRLLPYALRLCRLLEEARRVVTDDGEPRGSLAVGSLETTAALRLSSHLATYAAAHPKVDLILRTGTTCELVKEVLEYRLEGAFVCAPVEHPDLEQILAFREQLVVLTAPEVRGLPEAFGRRGLKIVVLRVGCSYRQRLEDILARRGIVDTRLLEFGTIEAIIGCVAGGIGITLLPKGLLGTAIPQNRVGVHELPQAESVVATVFVRRRDAVASSALAAFLALACPEPLRAAAAH
ncbi:MAG: LysR substrate-binding domain-containing protein [Stellaceae bacterium]